MKIAIISGKGGSGKSSISAAFVALAGKVVAVDCDVDASNLPLLMPHEVMRSESFVSGEDVVVDRDRCVGCGLCVDGCGFSALHLDAHQKAEANGLLCEGCGYCVKICPQHAISIHDVARSHIFVSRFSAGSLVYGNLYPGDDNSGKMIARIREIADEVMKNGNYDLQLLDGPPGISCPVLSTITGVDRIVIVAEPTLSGMSDLERACHVADSYCKDVHVIINKCNMNEENRRSIVSMCNKLNIPVLAELPLDRKFVEAQLACQSMITYAPASQTAHILTDAFERLLLR